MEFLPSFPMTFRKVGRYMYEGLCNRGTVRINREDEKENFDGQHITVEHMGQKLIYKFNSLENCYRLITMPRF